MNQGQSKSKATDQLAKETGRKPDVSVVVVVYNMAREAPRTLHSLSAGYQRHIDPDDYEVDDANTSSARSHKKVR
jgi:GT2 family glycosyltransferase